MSVGCRVDLSLRAGALALPCGPQAMSRRLRPHAARLRRSGKGHPFVSRSSGAGQLCGVHPDVARGNALLSLGEADI